MGDCNETLRELETFLDGELTPAALADIRAHLGDCPNCLEAFDFHAELKAVIAAKCRNDELPPGPAGAHRAVLPDRPRRRRPHRLSRRSRRRSVASSSAACWVGAAPPR